MQVQEKWLLNMFIVTKGSHTRSPSAYSYIILSSDIETDSENYSVIEFVAYMHCSVF